MYKKNNRKMEEMTIKFQRTDVGEYTMLKFI